MLAGPRGQEKAKAVEAWAKPGLPAYLAGSMTPVAINTARRKNGNSMPNAPMTARGSFIGFMPSASYLLPHASSGSESRVIFSRCTPNAA